MYDKCIDAEGGKKKCASCMVCVCVSGKVNEAEKKNRQVNKGSGCHIRYVCESLCCVVVPRGNWDTEDCDTSEAMAFSSHVRTFFSGLSSCSST